MSPISSRNNVPPFACSKRPVRCVVAPVNAPFSCPKSSDSINSFGIAATLSGTNVFSLRGLCWCNACATSSLPVPDSPLMRTEIFDCESLPIARNTSCMAGASPMISCGFSVTSGSRALCFSRECSRALRVIATASSISNGLGRYSNAPRL